MPLRILAAQLANLVATAALAAIGLGCWWERPSAGLIVPAAIVFACLVWGRIRNTTGEDADNA